LNTDMTTAQKTAKGFTLIELLIVIGILAILMAITLVALNPARQFAQSNNTKRRSDVNAILNAIHQYSADNQGLLTDLSIPTDAAGIIGNGTGEVDLCASLVPLYIAALPVDPQTNNGTPVTDCVASYATGYDVVSSATNNRVTASAPGAELSEVVSVTR